MKFWHKTPWRCYQSSGKQVASLRAVIHFSARLSFSAQKATLSCPGWVRRKTRPAGSPSYSSKFFCTIVELEKCDRK